MLTGGAHCWSAALSVDAYVSRLVRCGDTSVQWRVLGPSASSGAIFRPFCLSWVPNHMPRWPHICYKYLEPSFSIEISWLSATTVLYLGQSSLKMSRPGCFRGPVSNTQTKGIETTIRGVPTYVAEPENGAIPKGIIVVITDAFGWKFVNNRVLCDRYAKRGGFLVYCPDFMNGISFNCSFFPSHTLLIP